MANKLTCDRLAAISDTYEAFLYDESETADVQAYSVRKGNDIEIFGIDMNHRDDQSMIELRASLFSAFNLGDPAITRLVQIIGDSGTAYRSDSLPLLQNIISENVGANTVIEYGFTCLEGDVNWLVGKYVCETTPTRVLANIVGQTIDVLRDTGYTGSMAVTKFILVYSRETTTVFGDDTWASDGVMCAECGDRMICIEGGLQSFHQCVNVLLEGVPVLAVYGVRAGEANRFSAAELLQQLKTASNLEDVLSSYLNTRLLKTKGQESKVELELHRLIDGKINLETLIHTVQVPKKPIESAQPSIHKQ